jgi:hypothetical protein
MRLYPQTQLKPSTILMRNVFYWKQDVAMLILFREPPWTMYHIPMEQQQGEGIDIIFGMSNRNDDATLSRSFKLFIGKRNEVTTFNF